MASSCDTWAEAHATSSPFRLQAGGFELAEDLLRDGVGVEVGRLHGRWGGAGTRLAPARGGGFLETAVGQDAGDFCADVVEVFLLLGRQELARAAEVEPAQRHAGAEAFGEIRAVKHRIDEIEQLELDAFGLLPVAREELVVEFHQHFRHDVGGGQRAAVAAHQQRGEQDFLAADEAREVRSLRLDLVQRVEEARHVAAAVLDADDARAVQREPLHHGHADLVGELRDVVEDDVNRRLAGDLPEHLLDALLAHLIIIGAGDGHRRAAQLGVSGAGVQDLVEVRLRRAGQDRRAPARLLGDDLDDALALLEAEPDELPAAAVGVKAADALLDEPVHGAAQFILVDAAVVTERDEVRRVDALDHRRAW